MAGANVIDVTTANWEQEVVKSDKPVLVDFWAVWCGPCRLLVPTMDKLAEQFDGKVKVAKVNVDYAQEIAIKHGVNTLPQVLLFKPGEQLFERKNGVGSVDEFAKMLHRALEA
jgi:thioredoxin 1